MAVSDPAGPAVERPLSRVALFWEKGWLGSPTAGAAWTRGLIVLVYTLVASAAAALLWSHATYSGPLAFFEMAPPVLLASAGLAGVVYWLHGSMGQSFLYLSAALLAILVGGFAVGNAVFAVRGVASPAVIDGCTQHSDVREQWYECQVMLPDGAELDRSIRSEEDLPEGKRVTVSYDPGGFVAPAFGHRRPNLVVVDISGGGLALTVLSVVAATWTGERLRTSGRESIAQRPNPRYYPRRIAWQNEHTERV